MRPDIELLYKPEEAVPLDGIRIIIGDEDFSARVNNDDIVKIESIWRAAKSKNDTLFSLGRSLSTLHDTREGRFSYNTTDYKHYLAVTSTHQDKTLSRDLYETMRIAGMDITLQLAEELVFVHRRPYDASHVPGLLDSSAGGICRNDDSGNLNPKDSFKKIIQRELNLSMEEIVNYQLAAIHCAYAPEFSAVFDIVAVTNLERKQLEERIEPGIFAEFEFVPRINLATYVLDHFISRGDMCTDGVMTLLASLDHQEFLEAVRKIRQSNKTIESGHLEDGKFVLE